MLAVKALLFLGSLLPKVYANKPTCIELDVPIHVSLPLTQFNLPNFADSYQSSAFLASSVARTANLSTLVGGQSQLDQSFMIHAQYCEPEKSAGNHKGVLQVLSHGVGFDRSYWNFGNRTYNYVASATAEGYATLSYDRLGVGQSDHPDPYFEVQVPTQVAILAELTKLVREGKLSSCIPIPKKVVHIGHSFGSLISNGLVASAPELSDGVVLTGFSHNTSWTPLFELCLGFQLASLNDPVQFGHYNSGYLTWGDQYDNQCAFFSYPFFDPIVLQQAEAQKAPFAIAELLSFASVPLVSAGFTAPVLMISGQYDLPFCGGNCEGVLEGPSSLSPVVFSNAKPFASYIQPNAGHALNLHQNASAAYTTIFGFLHANGL